MKAGARRPRPSWRTAEPLPFRLDLWLVAAVAIGMLLVEVWQSSRVAELSFAINQTRSALNRTRMHVQHLRVESERQITRAELAPAAVRLGLAPAQSSQVVALPPEYIQRGTHERIMRTASRGGDWAERIARVLVPEATARSRAR